MPSQSRIGDIGVGTCPCHDTPVTYTTTFISGAESVLTNGQVSTIIGTVGNATCGHQTTAFVGSPNVFFENQPVHRISDTGANCGPYTTITGSPNVFIND